MRRKVEVEVKVKVKVKVEVKICANLRDLRENKQLRTVTELQRGDT